MTQKLEKISLYFSEGGSDKEYHVQIDQVATGFEVSFRYGRRGSSLTCGKKTTSPVEYDTAKKVYDKLVKEKMSKGYTPDVSGAAYQDAPNEARFTGILPQLLNPLDEDELPTFLHDPDYLMQEKIDGDRRLIKCDGTNVIGINRKGLEVALPQSVVDSALALLRDISPAAAPASGFLIDGEIVGEKYFAFDLLEINGVCRRYDPYEGRIVFLSALIELQAREGVDGIMILPVYESYADKKAVFDKVEATKGEGVVFKYARSSYKPGKENSGGYHRKFKFVADASVQVTAINEGKRSVSVCVFMGSNGENTRVDVGNLTIPPNKPMPNVDDILDVTYLYAFPGGSLFQPVYGKPRSDLDASDCKIEQLKYKREEAIAA